MGCSAAPELVQVFVSALSRPPPALCPLVRRSVWIDNVAAVAASPHAAQSYASLLDDRARAAGVTWGAGDSATGVTNFVFAGLRWDIGPGRLNLVPGPKITARVDAAVAELRDAPSWLAADAVEALVARLTWLSWALKQ